MKKIFSIITAVFMLGVFTESTYAANTTKSFMFDVDDSQIQHNFFNDVWQTGDLDLGGFVILGMGDTLTVDVIFKNNEKIRLNDGFFNGDESIKVGITGGAGTGGVPNNNADISFQFTDVMGGPLLVNPVVVTGVPYSPLNGNLVLDHDVDLINGGTVSFGDVHVVITNNNTNPWAISKVNLGVDADTIAAVPEPSTYLLLGSGLMMACLLKRRYATRK